MTTKAEISQWFDIGVNGNNKWMVVVCDTFDHEDYPIFFESDGPAQRHVSNPGSMQKVLETYDLTADKDSQIGQFRCNAIASLSD